MHPLTSRREPTLAAVLFVTLFASCGSEGPVLRFEPLDPAAISGEPLGPKVRVSVLDDNQPVAGATVELEMSDSCSGVALEGRTTANSNGSGVADFFQVWLRGRAAGCRLVARHGSAQPARSSRIDLFEVDAEQPSLKDRRLDLGGASHARLAQVVTVPTTGLLGGFRLPIACARGNVDYSVQGVVKATGLPDGVILGRGSLHALLFPGFGSLFEWYTPMWLETPVAVGAGDAIALVVETLGECWVTSGADGDPYPGGDGARDALPNEGWAPLGSPAFDLPFQILVL